MKTLIQISDVHLTLSGVMESGFRTRDNLIAALEMLATLTIEPDCIILSGDLAHAAEPACYEDLADLMSNVASALGSTVLYVPGNHDARPPFRRHLLGEAPSEQPINQTRWFANDLRVVALDSTIAGADEGMLEEATLEYLRNELSTTAPEGTIVVVHHPPITSPIAPMSRLRLQNAPALREIVEGTDVRLILSGHNHHEAFGGLGSVPVWVSPATAYRADTTSTEVFRPRPGSAISRIDVDDDDVVVTVMELELDAADG